MKNYQQIKKVILDSILKNKSTSALSRKLGYSFDKVKRWQNGSKQFRWNEFCDLCAITKIPLPEALGSSFGILYTKKKDEYKIVSNLKVFLNAKSSRDLAQKMGVPISVMQRYINGTTSPDVEFVLEMIDQKPEFLDLFVGSLLRVENSTSEKSFLTLPWTSAVASAASLKAHSELEAFSEEWIANFTGLSQAQVKQAIELMIELGMIEKKGSHYAPTLSRTIAVKKEIDPIQYARFIQFWMRRAEARFNTPTGRAINKNETPNKDAFRIFSASPEATQKVSDIIMKAEQEIHDLLQQDKNEKTDVRVMLLHHFSVQDFKI